MTQAAIPSAQIPREQRARKPGMPGHAAIKVAQKLALYALMTAICIALLFPTLWMLSTSLKPPGRVFEYPPRLVPDPITWQNYPEAINKFPFWLYLRNTVIITTVATFGTVLTGGVFPSAKRCSLCCWRPSCCRAS
jgi:ABC-type glycerol-3-phosphate transport system permease component